MSKQAKTPQILVHINAAMSGNEVETILAMTHQGIDPNIVGIAAIQGPSGMFAGYATQISDANGVINVTAMGYPGTEYTELSAAIMVTKQGVSYRVTRSGHEEFSGTGMAYKGVVSPAL